LLICPSGFLPQPKTPLDGSNEATPIISVGEQVIGVAKNSTRPTIYHTACRPSGVKIRHSMKVLRLERLLQPIDWYDLPLAGLASLGERLPDARRKWTRSTQSTRSGDPDRARLRAHLSVR
jgi:hypothetical protein